MTRRGLERNSRTLMDWKVGIDGSIVVITLGAGGTIDTDNLTSPIIGFIFDQTGLMYSLSLEGSKISRINP